MPRLQAVRVIRRATLADLPAWHAMRVALWPFLVEEDSVEQDEELRAMLADGDLAVFIAEHQDDGPVGFLEAALRRDYVDGCDASPVGFIEGLYVRQTHRLRGVARSLTDAAEQWTRERGCAEFASNALLDNLNSHAMHRALGFEETERVVFFRKVLD